MILGLTALMYIQQAIFEPLDKFSTVALSGIGILLALAGLSFALFPCLNNKEDKNLIIYVGEKFFHSSILLVQTLFIKFAYETLKSMEFFQTLWLKEILLFLFLLPLIILVSLATWFFIFGFEKINDFLWFRYEIRWKEYWKKPNNELPNSNKSDGEKEKVVEKQEESSSTKDLVKIENPKLIKKIKTRTTKNRADNIIS